MTLFDLLLLLLSLLPPLLSIMGILVLCTHEKRKSGQVKKLSRSRSRSREKNGTPFRSPSPHPSRSAAPLPSRSPIPLLSRSAAPLHSFPALPSDEEFRQTAVLAACRAASVPEMETTVGEILEDDEIAYSRLGNADLKEWATPGKEADAHWREYMDHNLASDVSEKTADPDTDPLREPIFGTHFSSFFALKYEDDEFEGERSPPTRQEEEDVVDLGEAEQPAVLPGDIATQPGSKIVFNAPYECNKFAYLKLTNPTEKRIGWRVSSPEGLSAYPGGGSLAPKMSIVVEMEITDFNKKDSDSLSLEWTNAPALTDLFFSANWFSVSRTKMFIIEFNQK